jgi:hypothetical protein
MRNSLQEYTKNEFLELLTRSFTPGGMDLKESDDLIDFLDNTQYPRGHMILINPSSFGIEDSPSAIVDEICRWYSKNSLPCFKEE